MRVEPVGPVADRPHRNQCNRRGAVTGFPDAGPPRRPLTSRRVELIAERLRVLGQPQRVKLIDELANQSMTGQELVDKLETTQQNVSRHLGILRRAGIVTRHKDGVHVRYELVDRHIVAMLDYAEASLAQQLGELAKEIEPNAPNSESPT
jgi:DNA-binding transcriptional ArsR family regulator